MKFIDEFGFNDGNLNDINLYKYGNRYNSNEPEQVLGNNIEIATYLAKSKIRGNDIFGKKEITLNIQSYSAGSYILFVKDSKAQILKNAVIIKQ